MSIAPDLLAELEQAVQHALASGDESGLDILGYGEVSPVLALATPQGRMALKRLPVFRDAAQLDRYRACFEAYMEALTRAGIQCVETRLESLPREDGSVIAYCVQPVLPSAALLVNVLARGDEPREWLSELVSRIRAAVSPRLGLDAQVSNWVVAGSRLAYLDLTTPLLRDEAGNDLLDQELFLASLPRALRWPVKRFLLREIIDKYHDPRGVLLDVAGNLLKERLEHLLPELLRLLGPAAPSEAEVRRYYAADARTWELLLRLRRADRFWQRRVRRRVYPFLLPGPIQR